MKTEDIEPWDWNRIIFGEAPVEFMAEVFIRTCIIFLALLVIVRLMGKRMGGQLTISELAIMVTLGAIVSPAMQIPQLGVLMGVMILLCALIFQRGLNSAEFKSQKFEQLSQGTSGMVVKDGVILLEEMAKSKISQQQLFSALRGKDIYNLGQIGRVYFETCGIFSIYKKEEPMPGLQIFPPGDEGINGFSQKIVEGARACMVGGVVKYEFNESDSCINCNSNAWIL